MKKLLLVLLVVTLASFLFVGCLPTTPTEGEGEGEGEGEAGICPTLSITSQVTAGGKNWIKGGVQTLTVTFAVPTEPVTVIVGGDLRVMADKEVVMYPNADKTVYTGTTEFGAEATCGEAYIYVETCDACAPCKYPYTVDSLPPTATVDVCVDPAACDGCILTFSSTVTEGDCADDTDNCDDACSGLASWSIDLYDEYPFEECCLVSCAEPIESDSGVCPISFTTAALTKLTPYYVVVTLVDNVGNSTSFGSQVTLADTDTCSVVTITPWTDDCLDDGELVECTE
jgi:hypothetical protein